MMSGLVKGLDEKCRLTQRIQIKLKVLIKNKAVVAARHNDGLRVKEDNENKWTGADE